MALMLCPNCGGSVSNKATACPHCKCKLEVVHKKVDLVKPKPMEAESLKEEPLKEEPLKQTPLYADSMQNGGTMAQYRTSGSSMRYIGIVIGIVLVAILGFAVFKSGIFFGTNQSYVGTWYSYAHSVHGNLVTVETVAKAMDTSVDYQKVKLTLNTDGTGTMVYQDQDRQMRWKKFGDSYKMRFGGKVEDDVEKEKDYMSLKLDGEKLIWTRGSEEYYLRQDSDYSVQQPEDEVDSSEVANANVNPYESYVATATTEPTELPTTQPVYNSYSLDDYADMEEASGDDWEEEEDEYIFQNSDSEYLSKSDLKGLDYETIHRAKNELYARHGRGFDSEDLQEYFDEQSWYEEIYTPKEWEKLGDKNFFNQYEIANRNLLRKREVKLK